MVGNWPRLAITEEGATFVVFTASLASKRLRELLSDDFNFELCLRKLSLEQQLKIRNARHDPVKALLLGLFAQVVLNYALYSGGSADVFRPFEDLPLGVNEYGKPRLDNGLCIEYNSSSSNDIMAIVVQFNGSTPVGVDLSHETQSSISETEFVEQFAGIFAPVELRQLGAIEDVSQRYVFFNQLWTLKEAFTKFVGCGLNVDLSSFHFQVGPARPSLRNPEVVHGANYNLLMAEWQRDIEVDFENLEKPFKSKILERPIHCQSSVLRTEKTLPVFISLVSQNPMESTEIIDLDMEKIVQAIIGD
ncbi:hypothetical protein METBIDRAFT_230685 [Metschnikowia bicuspidata var. bicuspidata NRRL YB-4993]|uniref:holo-[acyl-carrier-protein] synthase n=1 Tax=Metschnikowia bicuspidata var. bicuspidata NRRL YB-4993 TaxID=869754 RepID=A0A1A0H1X1_9ASCO|nr:hypothetical protein METBIDRAFT_230685 [Metschnikowia bicuspidata var. bicuspidata NRRL YB-4993]OBA17958.1 hypothetical protein METBIDRAFT_230685 [Metschnikowia bicuspidata var. bicuspidata NRRL YB-4993]